MEPLKQTATYQDGIDLREIVKALFRYKFWILIAIFIAAVIAWIVSGFLLPKQYRSDATILIMPAVLTDGWDPGAILLDLPEMKELLTLVRGDAVIAELNLSSDENIDLSPSVKGNTHLSLQVTADDPDQAADLANLWANEFLAYLHKQYNADSVFAEIEPILRDEYPKFEIYEPGIPDTLFEWHEAVQAVKLEHAQSVLALDLSSIDRIDVLLEDIQSFDQQLEQNSDNSISVEQAVILTTLIQRAAVGLSVGQVVYPSQDVSFEGYSVAQARKSLHELDVMVQGEKDAVENHAKVSEAALVKLALQFEALTSGQVAQVVIKAQPPMQPLGLSPWVNASLAGFLTLMLSGLVVVFLEWWRAPEENN